MQARPWQIAIIALSVVAAGASSAYLLTRSGPNIPTRMTLVDVSTGKLYELDKAKYRVLLPARSPDDGEIRLVPVAKDESGKWVVTGNGMAMLKGLTTKITAVNIETGEVTPAGSKVEKYIPPPL